MEEPVNITSFKKNSYDVFLGGTQSSQWRENIAIPILNQQNLSYPNSTNGYEILDNKIVTDYDVLQWKQMMDNSKVILFVITNDSRSLTTMILAAHYIAIGKNMVLCVQQLPEENCHVGNETVSIILIGWIVAKYCCVQLSEQAIKDYNRGRVYVVDMAKRKQIPVFEDIREAVQCVVSKVQSR